MSFYMDELLYFCSALCVLHCVPKWTVVSIEPV